MPEIKVISYFNFPCAMALILLDSHRRLYSGYSILMVFIRILLPFDFGPITMVALSYWLGSREPSLYKVRMALRREWSTLRWKFGPSSSWQLSSSRPS